MTEHIEETAWDFQMFRLHRPTDCMAMHMFVTRFPFFVPIFDILRESACNGTCVRDCLHCDKEIIRTELGGFVVMMPALANPESMIMLSPLCQTCARIDADILATRCIARINKKFFAGSLETGVEKVSWLQELQKKAESK